MIGLLLIVVTILFAFLIPKIGAIVRWVLFSLKQPYNIYFEKVPRNRFYNNVYGLVLYSLVSMILLVQKEVDFEALYLVFFFPFFLYIFPMAGAAIRWGFLIRSSKKYIDVYDGGNAMDLYIGFIVMGMVYMVLDYFEVVPDAMSMFR